MKKLIMVICMLVAFNSMASDKKVEDVKSTNVTVKADSASVKSVKDCSDQELSVQMKAWISDSSHWGKSHRSHKSERTNAELVAQFKNWMINSDFWEVED